MSVEFHAEHADLLEKAINGLGWSTIRRGNLWTTGPVGRSMLIDLDEGLATIQPEQQSMLNELKRAYSAQAIKMVAAKNRWTASFTNVAKTRGQFIKTYQ
jgi:hypothetical protein